MNKTKLLYIEDYPVVQQMYVDVLGKAGFYVDVAGDGKQALDYVAANEYDIVLLDLLLPQVTGLEFLREYRKKGRQGLVVVLTDFDNPATVQEIRELGVEHYWLKVENTPHLLVERLHKLQQESHN